MSKTKVVPSEALLGKVSNPLLVAEVVDLLKRFNLAEIERIPEVKHLINKLMELREERVKIGESMDLLSTSEIESLFKDYIENHFDGYLQQFFDKLYNGLVMTVRRSVNQRMDQIEDKIDDLKASVLMSYINPDAWRETELVNGVIHYLTTQPNYTSTVYAIYNFIAYQTKLPLPGKTKVEKMSNLVGILRHVESLKEYEGFLFELSSLKHVEDLNSYATENTHNETLSHELCKVGADQASP